MSHNISVVEKVIILTWLLSGHSNTSIAERWQHSPSTISAALHEVIDVILKKDMIDFLMIMIPPYQEVIDPEISGNPKMIDDFIGAFDGSHIPPVVEEEDQKAFHNRKGFLSQNRFVLVISE